jgi:hypothetical protein
MSQHLVLGVNCFCHRDLDLFFSDQMMITDYLLEDTLQDTTMPLCPAKMCRCLEPSLPMENTIGR